LEVSGFSLRNHESNFDFDAFSSGQMHGRPEVIVGSDEDQAIRQVVATGMNQRECKPLSVKTSHRSF